MITVPLYDFFTLQLTHSANPELLLLLVLLLCHCCCHLTSHLTRSAIASALTCKL